MASNICHIRTILERFFQSPDSPTCKVWKCDERTSVRWRHAKGGGIYPVPVKIGSMGPFDLLFFVTKEAPFK